MQQHGLLADILDQVQDTSLEVEGYRRVVGPHECVLIAHIHVLPSTIPFFRRLIELGFAPDAIIVAPKSYSTIPHARHELETLGCRVLCDQSELVTLGGYDVAAGTILAKACATAAEVYVRRASKRYILVDDGGSLTEHWWRLHSEGRDTDVISVQQTASGMFEHRFREPKVRRIDVARSAAKRFFEARIIVSGVLRKVAGLHVLQKQRPVGVVGIGYVGRQLAIALRNGGNKVVTYDKEPHKQAANCEAVADWVECVRRSDVIFGCTGRDFMKDGLHYLDGIGRRRFISLSSRDVEFRALLRSENARRFRRFGDAHVAWKGSGSFIVSNSGFPINFDREKEWEEEDEISLTRGLVLLGVVQAMYVRGTASRAIEKLALNCQRILVASWLKQRGKKCAEFGVESASFNDLRWWFKESGGDEYKGTLTSQAEAYGKQ